MSRRFCREAPSVAETPCEDIRVTGNPISPQPGDAVGETIQEDGIRY